MSLTRDQVRRVAGLARLDLAVEDEERFAAQLGRVVEYIDQLNAFETAESPETAANGILAVDEPVASLPTENFLANAPERFGPYVAVPRVLETDD